jgi:hypothetical protein
VFFPVASKRFTDNVPLAVDRKLLQSLAESEKLNKLMCTYLGIAGPKGYQVSVEFARESSVLAAQREDLMHRLERLEKARSEFDMLTQH